MKTSIISKELREDFSRVLFLQRIIMKKESREVEFLIGVGSTENYKVFPG